MKCSKYKKASKSVTKDQWDFYWTVILKTYKSTTKKENTFV